MVYTNFSGTTIKPTAVPDGMSVYASCDGKKAATALLVLNKGDAERPVTLAIQGLPPRTVH